VQKRMGGRDLHQDGEKTCCGEPGGAIALPGVK
jgi:hypothetical protein